MRLKATLALSVGIVLAASTLARAQVGDGVVKIGVVNG